MRRKVYLIGGFGLGWRKVMLELIAAAEQAGRGGGPALRVTGPDPVNGEHFSVASTDGVTEVDFTVLKWNDLSKQYYRNGVAAFWSKVARMYAGFISNADWKVVARLPGRFLFMFLTAPFALVLLFALFAAVTWTLLSGPVRVPPEYALVTSLMVSGIATWFVLNSAGIILFLRGLLFSADSLMLKSGLLDEHIRSFRERVLGDIRDGGYDEVVVLGFSHGCKLMVLLMSELYRSGVKDVRDKTKAVFVAQALPLGLLLKTRTKLREAVLQLGQLDVTFFNVFNSGDPLCSSDNALFFPCDDGIKACVADLDTHYDRYMKGFNRLKARFTFHYAHKLYFRPLDRPCPHGMIGILCSPLYLEENPVFTHTCGPGEEPAA